MNKEGKSILIILYIRYHYERHSDFNLQTDKVRAKKINTFDKFKKVALSNGKFLNETVYKCPIITSYKLNPDWSY